MGVAWIRRYLLTRKALPLPVPVVVVGNISVGGVGKTPVVIALAQALVDRGGSVGIISRGYGGHSTDRPLLVDAETALAAAGDEAKQLFLATHCPVVVCKNRHGAAEHLLRLFPQTQVIISDDGLQHYRLGRSMEIAVIDGHRGLGNGWCLPAGPLRESKGRLRSVDWVLVNGGDGFDVNMPSLDGRVIPLALTPFQWQHLKTRRSFPLQPLPWEADKPVVAVAAIGNPERFFATLSALNIAAETLSFDDHYAFSAKDFYRFNDRTVVMTTKDAVKCLDFAQEHWWALDVKLPLPDELIGAILDLID